MIMDEEEGGGSEGSRDFDPNEVFDFEAAPPITQLTREELEEALEDTKLNLKEERNRFETEKKKYEDQLERQAKLMVALEKDNNSLKNKKDSSFLPTIFTPKRKLSLPPPAANQESSGIIGDLLAQIKELSVQRAGAMDALDDLKEDLAEAKKQVRTNAMESISLRTQIASLEEKIKTLEDDPNRPHTPRESPSDTPIGQTKIIRELEEKLEDQNMIVSKVTRENQKQERRIKQLLEDWSAQSSLAEIKQKELNILIQENTGLRGHLDARKLCIDELQKKVEELKKKNEELESYSKDKDNLQRRINELETQLTLKTEKV